ncbi:MAG TPA: hypothetical protein VHY08_22540 [Bacillota bacterium]|nr:hypothetical protein [Bacillota bacterium]
MGTRYKYLQQSEGRGSTFQSVILAGIHDVKTMKLKLLPDEERKFNSPWNIAAEFEVDLSLNVEETSTMLKEYGQDRKISIDNLKIAEKLHYYSSGYPFLVSRLCEIIDLKLLPKKARPEWTVEDVDEAFRLILKENNPNFDALIKNLENNPELDELTQRIILDGANISFVRTDSVISLGIIYGVFAERDGICVIHNRIYESLMYDHLMMKRTRLGWSSSPSNKNAGLGA